MSELKFTEKMSDAITNTISDILKKSKLFDKINRVEFILTMFVAIPVVSLTGFGYMLYINNCELKESLFKNKIKSNNDLQTSLENINKNLENRVNELEKKLCNMISEQQKSIDQITEMPILNICKNEPLSKTSSNISLFLDNDKDCDIEGNIEENIEENVEGKEEENTKQSIIYESNINKHIFNNEDLLGDELSNDCYDNIPLSNAKKLTGIKGLFWFQ